MRNKIEGRIESNYQLVKLSTLHTHTHMQIVAVQLLSRVHLFATSWTAA